MEPELFENELLKNILPFWMTFTPDTENGGFFGQIDANNQIDNSVPRTAVTCARILWTFSHAYLTYQKREYLAMAERAFDYLNTAFWDDNYQGLFWSVDQHGSAVLAHKHFYAQAFGIYGFSEYFKATQNMLGLTRAIQLFNIIENHAFDKKFGGYIESKSREFQTIADMRLSDKDMNCRKSMNTLLHIIEAYTNLFLVWDSPELRNQLYRLITDFNRYVFNSGNGHLFLFFDDDWRPLTDHISCGHEIESSWLLCEAAETIGDAKLTKSARDISLRLADSVLETGISPDGSVIYEGTLEEITNPAKEWWPQTEAIIGFYHGYQLSGDEKFAAIIPTIWHYLQEHFIDKSNGGWFKRMTAEGFIDMTSPKVGPWECPYHESRMCFEMMERMRAQEKDNAKDNASLK